MNRAVLAQAVLRLSPVLFMLSCGDPPTLVWGKVCDTPTETCSAAVHNLTALDWEDRFSKDWLIDRWAESLQAPGPPEPLDLDIGGDGDRRFSFPSAPLSPRLDGHNQGVGLLRSFDGRGRLLWSEDDSSVGLHLLFEALPAGEEQPLTRAETALDGQVDLDVMSELDGISHAHPGGLQAHGDFAVVAMEQGSYTNGDAAPAAVLIVQAEGDRLSITSRLLLDGTHGEGWDSAESGASAAGFVQMEDGRFLLAVAGSGHGKDDPVWFYRSDGTRLDEDTRWSYLGEYTPPCKGWQDAANECWLGASSLSLVTSWDGAVWMIATHGSDFEQDDLKGGWDEYEFVQIFQVQTWQDQEVHLELYAQARDNLGGRITDDIAFRWAGGAAVSLDGELMLLATERGYNDHDPVFGTSDVDGGVYVF